MWAALAIADTMSAALALADEQRAERNDADPLDRVVTRAQARKWLQARHREVPAAAAWVPHLHRWVDMPAPLLERLASVVGTSFGRAAACSGPPSHVGRCMAVVAAARVAGRSLPSVRPTASRSVSALVAVPELLAGRLRRRRRGSASQYAGCVGAGCGPPHGDAAWLNCGALAPQSVHHAHS